MYASVQPQAAKYEPLSVGEWSQPTEMMKGRHMLFALV